ncbi:winged helix-turn-helix domain-containing protein [Streptomyces sp. NPDC059629]|uniref:helix-turn-helix domain-containing protein n=1 Tax=Streptomyces sp. NPDC059629 TaxID=3346889 RepID=UPI00368250F6
MFHVRYTVQGLWKLLRRHGWSAQVPLRRAIERDDEAIEVWKAVGAPPLAGECGRR